MIEDFTVVDIVAAIAADLEPLATKIAPLGFTTWLHRPPDQLTSEQAPWLAVFSENTMSQLIATIGDYQDNDVVEVQWAISIAEYVEQGGVGSDAVIAKAIVDLRPVTEHLKGYAAGLPEPFDNQVLGTLVRTDRSTEKALCWVQSWFVTVTSMGIG